MSPLSVATSRSTYTLETGGAKLWILLVGVNSYQDESLPSLRYSAVDCQGLAEALVEATQAFPQKELIVHHDFAAQPAQLKHIRTSLKQIVAVAKQQDTILFYFSGHGVLEPYSQQAVLCLADTQKDKLLSTGLRLSELLQQLNSCAAHKQLVWLDACHSGGISILGSKGETPSEHLLNPTSHLVEVLRKRAAQSKGFYALLSCDQAQQSWEFPELGHGVFTYYLMRGLYGEAADSQGVIEVDGLYKYVYYQTLQYIDKINQQLRLINQQKQSRGEKQFYPEYPLQTPKRIVEGVGEIIIGQRPDNLKVWHPRQAIVVEGLPGSKTLALSKVLRQTGNFELEYLPRPGKGLLEVREAIQNCLRQVNCSLFAAHESQQSTINHERTTLFLYLRGRIAQTEEGEAWLVLGDNIRLSRSWLRQELRHCSSTQQIVVLDCLGVETLDAATLQNWIEDLQLKANQGQCLIAAASPANDPERFAQALLETLVVEDAQVGLTVAGWISQLQVKLAGTGMAPLIWLSPVQGVLEILPGRIGSPKVDKTAAFDLGLCPYMGLRAFGEEDAQYFYGREALTQQLINQISDRAFLSVVGASGSGKSSAIHAGLIAQLRQGKQIPGSDQWWIKSFRPGANPLQALAARLVDPGTEKERAYQQMQLEGMLYQGTEGFVYWLRTRPERAIVLVVDQFEELFTLAAAEDRKRFLDILLGAVQYAADRFKLVIALRADFIASCLEVPELAQIIPSSSTLVPSCLTADDYRQIIVKPAQKVGLQLESELVEVLLRELNHSPGDLPLLEFVLEQLWEHRSSSKLTLQAYLQQIGGLRGAIERKAQAVYDSLDAEAQACAQWIFLTLTQLGEGTEDTRRRVYKSELFVKKYPDALLERTLQALTTAKLVVIDWETDNCGVGGSRGAGEQGKQVEKHYSLLTTHYSLSSAVTVEVAHEILIRHWSTLRWWLDENRVRLRLQRQIEQAALLWQQNHRQSDYLWQGIRLEAAAEIYIKYTDELSQDVQLFIDACLEARRIQQLQTRKRLRQAQASVIVISIMGTIASSLAGLAYLQKRAAQFGEIEALNLSSTALLLSNQQLEALTTSVKAGQQLQQMALSSFGLLGVSAKIQTQTVSSLQRAVYGTRERDRLVGHSRKVNSVSFSPDGILATASDDKTVKLWSADGQLLKTLAGHADRVTHVAFRADGEAITSASADKTIKLWSRDHLLTTFTGHQDWVNSVSFSPDGKTLASASRDQTVKLWSLDGTLRRTLNGHSGWVNSVSFSPDGHFLASASEDNTVKLWRVADGKLLQTLRGHSDRVNSVNFSPDGQTLVSASDDNTVKLWNMADGSSVSVFTQKVRLNSVSFSPDGQTLAGVGGNTVVVWQREQSWMTTLGRHEAEVFSVSFSPDGKTLATASADKTVRLWSTQSSLRKYGSGFYSTSFSPDGTIASAGWDGTIQWSKHGVTSGLLFKTLPGHQSVVFAVRFSPNGKILASASADKTIKLWRIADAQLLKTLKGHHDSVTSISFSPNGDILASASADKTIKLWRVADGQLLQALNSHSDGVTSVSFSPDGKTLASGSYDNTVKLWSVNGQLLRSFDKHASAIAAVSFSPDGKILASASWDNTIKLWNPIDGTLIHNLTQHTDSVTSLDFSTDGQILASGSADGTVKLWSVADGEILGTLTGHSDSVKSLSFSPNGTLLSASEEAGTILWNLDLNDLLRQGCDRLNNYLKTNPGVKDSDRSLCDPHSGAVVGVTFAWFQNTEPYFSKE